MVNKANYAPAGTMLTVKWENGAYIVEGGANSLDKRAIEIRVDETFLALLSMFSAQGQDASPNPSPSYAPSRFADHPNANGFSKKQFAAAMQRLLVGGKIRIEQFGPPSRQRSRLVLNEGGKAANL